MGQQAKQPRGTVLWLPTTLRPFHVMSSYSIYMCVLQYRHRRVFRQLGFHSRLRRNHIPRVTAVVVVRGCHSLYSNNNIIYGQPIGAAKPKSWKCALLACRFASELYSSTTDRHWRLSSGIIVTSCTWMNTIACVIQHYTYARVLLKHILVTTGPPFHYIYILCTCGRIARFCKYSYDIT